MSARERYEAAKRELRAATEARARDFDARMREALDGIRREMERAHGAALRSAELRLETAARALRQGRTA